MRRWFDLFYLLLLVVYIVAGVSLTPFHGDESTLIYMSRDYAYQFLQGDLDRVTYHDPPLNATEQELRLLNGTIPKYLFGLAWHTAGFDISDINEQWDWGADWNYNQTTGHAPGVALLQTARWASAIPFAIGAIFIFVIGLQLGGRPTAYLAALYYALSPALLLNGRRAMMEGAFIAFSLLVVLAALWWARWTGKVREGQAPPLRIGSWAAAAILLGVAAGCALASKHTAVFTVAAVFAACGGIVLKRFFEPPYIALTPDLSPSGRGETPGETDVGMRASASVTDSHEQTVGARHAVPELQPKGDQNGRAGARPYRRAVISLLQLACAGLIALILFYALNPAWWGDPIGRASEVLTMRQSLLEGQTAFFGGYNGIGDALGGFFRQTFIGLPQYYEVSGWENWIGDQITAVESSVWRGVSLGGGMVGGLILLVLVMFGCIRLFIDRKTAGTTRWIIGVWAGMTFLAVLLLTPIEWGRYYLPALPAVGLLSAFGLTGVIHNVRRRRSTPPD
jgi:hypothetical protein